MEITDVVLYARLSKANCHQDPELLASATAPDVPDEGLADRSRIR
jgi:hypothetical protein